MKITAAIVPARSAPFELHEVDLAAPHPDEVLVRIIATGMCHTDLHARDGYFANLPYPVVCGHDGAPVYSCFFQQSSFATFALAPAKDVVRIRRDAPVEMLGPLGCGLQTGAGAVLNVMQPHQGQSIAIFGVGGVGLAGLMAAKIAGCDPIIAVDRLSGRLALARELGATHALESRGAETLTEIRKITGGGTHFALETSAVPEVFRLAVDGLRGLGTCVLVGSARAGTEVSFEMPVLQGGRTVRGVVQGDSRPREFIPRLVDLFMGGQMPLDRLITSYDFAQINRTAADAMSGATIKPVLRLPV